MITKELTAQVKAELELGKSAAQIKEGLIANNWSHEDVEAAFSQTQPQPSRLQRLERKLPMTLHNFGLLLFIPYLLLRVFNGGVFSLGISVVLFAVAIGFFIGLGKLFKFEGPLTTKTLLIVGATSVILTVDSAITQFLDWPIVSLLLLIGNLVGNLVVAKMLFDVSWLKTIGFYITYGIVLSIFLVSVGALVFSIYF